MIVVMSVIRTTYDWWSSILVLVVCCRVDKQDGWKFVSVASLRKKNALVGPNKIVKTHNERYNNFDWWSGSERIDSLQVQCVIFILTNEWPQGFGSGVCMIKFWTSTVACKLQKVNESFLSILRIRRVAPLPPKIDSRVRHLLNLSFYVILPGSFVMLVESSIVRLIYVKVGVLYNLFVDMPFLLYMPSTTVGLVLSSSYYFNFLARV